MKSLRQFFRRGGGTSTISGLILATALSVGLIISCKEDNSSKPTAPNIPVGPDWQTSENSNQMGFYSAKGDGQFGAYVGTNNEFQISVPAGDYVLEYTTQNTSTNSMQAVTTAGPFHVVFRASQPSILVIGLFGGVNINSNVSSASVSHGSVKTFSSSTSWTSNAVTLISWPGGGIASWLDAFLVNAGIAPITLIQNGAVVSGVNPLPAPSQPVERPTAVPPTVAANPTPGVTATPTSPQTEKVMLSGTYYDAEKLTSEDGMNMCWAAAPANALMWGDWATAFNNAQDVFRKFQEYWVNAWNIGGPGPKDSIAWWFGGDNTLSSSIKTNYIEKTGGGSYWPTESLGSYYSEESFSINSVNLKIREQSAVMIMVTRDGVSGHWFNVWGFEKDASKPNEEYLYITDNQDGDANNSTPKRVTVKLEGGVWRLSDYTYSGQTGWNVGGTMGALKRRTGCPINASGVPMC